MNASSEPESNHSTSSDNHELTVFYDAKCPGCVRDRRFFERISGHKAKKINWLDVSSHRRELENSGIDPTSALLELHVRDEQGRIVRELDAYILLMHRSFWLRPLAWTIRLPLVRPLLSHWYRRWVRRRLCRTGRL